MCFSSVAAHERHLISNYFVLCPLISAGTVVGNLQNVADIALAPEEMDFGDVLGLEQFYDE